MSDMHLADALTCMCMVSHVRRALLKMKKL